MKKKTTIVLIAVSMIMIIGGCIASKDRIASPQAQYGSAKVTETMAPNSEHVIFSATPVVVEPVDEIAQAYDEGRYLDVISLYEQALRDPDACITQIMKDKYSASFNKYVDRALEKAQNVFGTEKNYDAAIAVLESFLSETYNIGKISKPLEQARAEYITSKYVELINKSYQSQEWLLVARQYEAALYDGAFIAAETEQQYDKSVSAYVASVSDAANKAFGNRKDYIAAMSEVSAALSEANDVGVIARELEAIMDVYATYIPIPLTSLQYTQKTKYIEVADKYTDGNVIRDVNGKSYNSGFVLFAAKFDQAQSEEEAYIQYNLNYQYSTITGTVFRPYDSLSCDHPWKDPSTMKIYGDGLLLYEAPSITMSTYDAYDFSLDVSGVRNLKIVLFGQWTEPFDMSLGFNVYHSKICLGDLMLQR